MMAADTVRSAALVLGLLSGVTSVSVAIMKLGRLVDLIQTGLGNHLPHLQGSLDRQTQILERIEEKLSADSARRN